jgi:hypothetical protein
VGVPWAAAAGWHPTIKPANPSALNTMKIGRRLFNRIASAPTIKYEVIRSKDWKKNYFRRVAK